MEGDSLILTVHRHTVTRSWLRPLSRRQWQPFDITVTSSGRIIFTPIPGHHHHTVGPPLQIVPDGARRATHSEQITHLRDHLLVLTTFPASSAGPSSSADFRPRRTHHFCQAKSLAEADRIVRFANTASLVPAAAIPLPIAAPLRHAWGTSNLLPVSIVLDVAAELGLSLTPKRLHDLLEKSNKLSGKPDITFNDFVSMMMYFASTELRGVFSQLQHNFDISPQSFHKLFHPENIAIDRGKAAAPHDMTQPLTNYLISSSHNTYLTGDQFQSASSKEMYRLALERGCRCVEIDVWSGDNGQPVVTHGHTMTTDEPLDQVLTVIADHAFRYGNDLPVIISLENHLDIDQQLVAASYFHHVFGDKLYTIDEPQMTADGLNSSIDANPLPCPSSLRGRFILKTKSARPIVQQRRPDDTSVNSEDGGNDSFDSEDSTEDDTSGDSGDSSNSNGESSTRHKSKKRAASTKKKAKSRGVKIAADLDKLVWLANGNRKALLSLWKRGNSGVDVYLPSSCISLDEKRLWDAQDKLSDLIREYNSHAFTRVYPKGTRIGSSNYTPTLAHSLGCQIVALNWQHHDAALAVNEARFLSNGGCGYVLASSVRPPLPARRRQLQICIICAFLLPHENSRLGDVGDPYCSIKLYDENFCDDDDYSCFKFETGCAKNNSFIPVWNKITRIGVCNPNLAVINLKVYDRDRTSGDDLVGYCAVPTSLLREGIRNFPLKSKKGDKLNLPGTDIQPSVLCDIRWLN